MRNLLFVGLSLTLYAATATAQPGPGPSSLSMQASVPAAAKAKETTRYNGTPAAQEALKAGDKAKQSGDFDEALKDYKKAVSLDPNYAEAHKKYVLTRLRVPMHKLFNGSTRPTPEIEKKVAEKVEAIAKKLIAKYEGLTEQHSDSAIYPWALGLLFNETDLARQKSLCQQAVHRDKHFARGWECLSHIAALRANEEKALAYYRRAIDILPDDEETAAGYAFILNSDGKAHVKEIEVLLRRFPKSSSIARALVESANKLEPEEARTAALETLRKDPPLSDESVAMNAARKLYPILLADNLRKAQALAHDMAGPKGKNKQWAQREQFVNDLIKTRHELDASHAQSALASLMAIKEKANGFVAENRWYLLEAKALDAAGRPADAVAKLRDRFIKSPSEAVYQAMVSYGAKIGKSKVELNDTVWTAIRAQAKPAHPFTLKRLDNQGLVSLSDYRGTPVIVDFWYPNCSPCRASFPYLDKVAVKFQDQGLAVLAINSIQEQQPLALPYLRGMGYHFIGLAGDIKFAKDAYGVKGYPTTFFIGPKGNILFKIHPYDDATQRSAEAAVKFMLGRPISSKQS